MYFFKKTDKSRLQISILAILTLVSGACLTIITNAEADASPDDCTNSRITACFSGYATSTVKKNQVPVDAWTVKFTGEAEGGQGASTFNVDMHFTLSHDIPGTIGGSFKIDVLTARYNGSGSNFDLREEWGGTLQKSAESNAKPGFNIHIPYSSANTQVTKIIVRTTSITTVTAPLVRQVEMDAVLRCDDLWTTPGCVNVAFTPTLNFSPSKYPYVSKNIRNGFSKGYPSTLNRVDGGLKDDNRKVACSDARKAALGPKPDFSHTPWKDTSASCDEYPFASSRQGGSATVIAWVPSGENSSQGGTLGGFYARERVMDGDLYRVTVQ
ncbi:NucA/NucB deoxyribonuclease domain-containing protein [Gordonia sp. CPCC 205333]|uniref:NucA/NucB deoxyribonuclease domain-containing protein n=1 Tax=Gordonia sp. CPCC 205333 TaxID=3140790 RepID=UPI003AF3C14B